MNSGTKLGSGRPDYLGLNGTQGDKVPCIQTTAARFTVTCKWNTAGASWPSTTSHLGAPANPKHKVPALHLALLPASPSKVEVGRSLGKEQPRPLGESVFARTKKASFLLTVVEPGSTLMHTWACWLWIPQSPELPPTNSR